MGSQFFLVGLKTKVKLDWILVSHLTYLVHLLLHVLDALLEEHLRRHLGDELLLQPPDCVVLHQAANRDRFQILIKQKMIFFHTIVKNLT